MLSPSFGELLAIDIANRPENLRWKKQKVLSALRDLYGMDVAFISRFTPTDRIFDAVDQGDKAAALAMHRGDGSALDHSYCYRIAEGVTPCLIPNARLEPSVADIPETWEMPIGAHVSVPIVLSNGVIWGMLCAFSREPRQDLTDRDIAMFGIYAEMLSRDIEVQIVEGGHTDGSDVFVDEVIRSGLKFQLQPIVSLPGAHANGYEALTRFPPEMGSVEAIFRRAKYHDRIVSLEEAVARQAASLAMQMRDDVFVSVNFSVTSIETLDFESIFPASLRSRIVLEVTEHERISDYAGFLTTLTRLRKMGFRIAVDDVGAGYSSLRHVIQLKPDFLKLDRSLIVGLLDSPEQRGLVKALAELVQSQGGNVIAEGIERADEVPILQEIGITMAQGYFFGQPLPSSEVLTFSD